MKIRKLFPLFALSAAALLLSGCAGDGGIPEPKFPVPTPSLTIADPIRTDDGSLENTFTVTGPTEGKLVLSGSGSCAPALNGDHEGNELTITINTAVYAAMSCTADLTFYSYKLKTNAGEFTEETTVLLSDGETVTELDVIVPTVQSGV